MQTPVRVEPERNDAASKVAELRVPTESRSRYGLHTFSNDDRCLSEQSEKSQLRTCADRALTQTWFPRWIIRHEVHNYLF